MLLSKRVLSSVGYFIMLGMKQERKNQTHDVKPSTDYHLQYFEGRQFFIRIKDLCKRLCEEVFISVTQ